MQWNRGIRIVAACVALATAPALAADRSLKVAQGECKKGEQALRSGDAAQAKQHFEKCREAAPGYPSAELALGHLAMADKRYADALASYQGAEVGYQKYGAELKDAETKRYAETQSQIASLRDSINQLNAPATTAGDAALQISKLQNAIQQLEAIQPPRNDGGVPGEVYFYIGNAQFQLGKLDDAIRSWETCVERSGQFAMVHNNLALAYWKTGDLERAVTNLELAEKEGFPVNPQFKTDLFKASGRSPS